MEHVKSHRILTSSAFYSKSLMSAGALRISVNFVVGNCTRVTLWSLRVLVIYLVVSLYFLIIMYFESRDDDYAFA